MGDALNVANHEKTKEELRGATEEWNGYLQQPASCAGRCRRLRRWLHPSIDQPTWLHDATSRRHEVTDRAKATIQEETQTVRSSTLSLWLECLGSLGRFPSWFCVIYLLQGCSVWRGLDVGQFECGARETGSCAEESVTPKAQPWRHLDGAVRTARTKQPFD